VVELDPASRPAYEVLASVYRDLGEKEKHERLRAEHLRRFKKSL
jgi:hypothetical protein